MSKKDSGLVDVPMADTDPSIIPAEQKKIPRKHTNMLAVISIIFNSFFILFYYSFIISTIIVTIQQGYFGKFCAPISDATETYCGITILSIGSLFLLLLLSPIILTINFACIRRLDGKDVDSLRIYNAAKYSFIALLIGVLLTIMLAPFVVNMSVKVSFS